MAKLAHLGLAILVMSSCFYRETVPKVTPKSTLEIDDPSASPSDQPFGIVFASPQGETTESTEISILFNRPMRTLDLSGSETPSPATISPHTPGSWRWIGTQGLYFAPETRLPYATDLVVSIPAETRSLDGTSLSEPYVFRFNTTRPALVRVTPSHSVSHLRPSSSFILDFNQPIADEEIARAIKLTASSKPDYSIPFDVKRPYDDEPNSVRIVPSQPLPVASNIRITAHESLRGTEGPLTAGKPAEFGYSTYGPLRVLDYYCGYDEEKKVCGPYSSVHIKLSNPVYESEARKSVSISPTIKLSRSEFYRSEERPEQNFSIRADFLPLTTYRITIKATLRDAYGQSLGKDAVVQVPFGNHWTNVEIGAGDSYRGTYRFFMDPGSIRDIPVTYTNASSMDLLTVRVIEDDVALLGNRYDVQFDQLAALPGANRVHVHHPADPNRSATHVIRPADVLGGKDKRGPLLIATRYTANIGDHGTREFSEHKIVQVTDLGISAKISPYGSLVWIKRLSDGKPVDGAEVRIRAPGGSSSTDQLYTTDSNGIAVVDGSALRVPKYQEAPAIIIAKHGQDWVFKSARDVQEWYMYGEATISYGDAEPIGMVFTDRGIYRPGNTVKIKAILREPGSQNAVRLARKNAKVTITGRGNKTIAVRDVKLNQFGTFAFDFRVPENTTLGKCSIALSVDGSERKHATGSFELAEYRPAELKVLTEFDRRSYIRGDSARCRTHGEYLFGSPMSAASVSMTVRPDRFQFRVPNTDGFVTSDYEFGRPNGWSGYGRINELPNRSKLDQRGDAELNTKLEIPQFGTTDRINCEAEIWDFSRQTVASSATAIVHPAEFYLGIARGSTGFAVAGGTIAPQIIAVDPEGRRQTGVAANIRVIQHTWTLPDTVPDNVDPWRSATEFTNVVGQCTVHTTTAPQSCSINVPASGFYTIRADAVDRRGNPIAASTAVYATGPGTPLLPPKTHYGDDFELVPDRKHYEVGETANIIVKSPFPDAEALVTVERDGIYSHKIVRLQGTMPVVQIPITKDFEPNAYVSVLIIRGRTKDAPDSMKTRDRGAPKYHISYATIRVNPEAKRLKVGLSTGKTEYRPGEQVTVDLKVTDRAGKGHNAEVTVYAVDEGVLMLTNYRTPNPMPVFSADQPLRVHYADTRHKPDLVRFSADRDSDYPAQKVRTDFRQTVYYNPSIITDNAGNARVTFKLPDNLTSYRIMAVAVGRTDMFGSGESTIRSSLPLLARAAFPRVLRAGDELDAGVVVTSKSIPKSNIDVTASVVGAQLIGPTTQRIELETLRTQEVRFRFRANSVGNAKFKFHVKGGGKEDTLEFTKPVKSPAILETVALYGSTNTASGEKLGDLSAMRSDVGDLSISMSSTALVGLGANLKYLTQYPYDCSEQLASRLVPLVPLRALSKFYSIPIPENTSSFVASTVGKLSRRQKEDGGFGIWEESNTSHPWVSAYVLWSLSLAKNAGIDVPDDTIESGVKYLRKYLESRDESEIGVATSAFLVDVLAETGESDADTMSRLYEKRSDMPLFSRALLAHAMSVGNGDMKSRNELIRDLEAHVRIQGNVALVAENRGTAYHEVMDSATRTNALVLRAMLAANKKHSLAAPMARGILAARKNGSWGSTQETAYALLALEDYRSSHETKQPDFLATVWLGKDQLAQQRMAGEGVSTFDLSIRASRVAKSGGSPLIFQVDGNGTGTLHYEARLRFARKTLPTEQLDRGFAVLKSMRIVTPESLKEDLESVPTMTRAFPSPKGGNLVLVDLLVAASQPSSYVIIDDPVPAGLEIVDSGLVTTARSSSLGSLRRFMWFDLDDRSGFGSFDDADYDTFFGAGPTPVEAITVSKEFRDDCALFFVEKMPAGMHHYRYLARATTIGKFVMPPTRAESMYQPEVYGRTGAAVISVVP